MISGCVAAYLVPLDGERTNTGAVLPFGGIASEKQYQPERRTKHRARVKAGGRAAQRGGESFRLTNCRSNNTRSNGASQP
jgi:hypothetical protein